MKLLYWADVQTGEIESLSRLHPDINTNLHELGPVYFSNKVDLEEVVKPGAPAAPVLTTWNGQITASWAPVSGAHTYHLYYADQAGSPRALNIVMLGMLSGSGLLPFPHGRLLEVVLDSAIRDFGEINRTAFHLGEDAMRGVKVR